MGVDGTAVACAAKVTLRLIPWPFFALFCASHLARLSLFGSPLLWVPSVLARVSFGARVFLIATLLARISFASLIFWLASLLARVSFGSLVFWLAGHLAHVSF